MLDRMKRIAMYVAAVVVAIYAAFVMGVRREKSDERVREAVKAYDNERVRRRIDEDIKEDTDLAGRARRAGIVRKD